MTDQYLSQNQLLLAEVEAVRGTEEAPVVGTNAVKVDGITYSAPFDVDPNDSEHSASLDGGAPIVLGGGVRMAFGVRMKGSGTGGTPPEWGPLVQGCGMAVTNTAAAVTGTAQAGAANTITLAAGASATDDAYKGMPIETTGGTGSGQWNIITAYNGTTKVATVIDTWATNPDITTTYSIPASDLYAPASQDLSTVTLFGYQMPNESAVNARLRKLIGGVGTMTLELGVNQIPRMAFTFDGVLPALPTNVTQPGAATYDATTAPPFRNALANLGTGPVKFNRFSLDLGLSLALPDNPAATYGKDFGAVTKRAITGSISPYLKLLSTRNNLSDLVGETDQAVGFRWGGTAGNRISILCPTIRFTGVNEQDIDGFAGESLDFRAHGADTGVYICVH